MKLFKYFTKNELLLWFISASIIIITFIFFDQTNYLTLAASLIGVTSLIFNAKGNPFGQLLMIIFSLLYGVISYSFSYYEEMITYLGMTAPMALFALISWLKNPYKGKKSEVKVNNIKKKDILFMIISSLITTIIFYFILKYFNTPSLLISTLSITTSFVAAYLTYKRSPFFALAYACNDIVLIILWIIATITNITYISITTCFIIFFFNDIYGYINWKRLQRKQSNK